MSFASNLIHAMKINHVKSTFCVGSVHNILNNNYVNQVDAFYLYSKPRLSQIQVD